jgi:Uma2 family endonuclease
MGRWQALRTHCRHSIPDAIKHPKAPKISGAMSFQLRTFLKGKPCELYLGPLDIRHNVNQGDDTVVQPDVLVICDSSKLADDLCCNGAPDFAIEVLLEETTGHERIVKFQKYLEAGIREYWIIDPIDENVQVYVLHDGVYVAHMYENTGTIPVSVLKVCQIDLGKIFG